MSVKTYNITIVTRREWYGTVTAFSKPHAVQTAFDLWHNADDHSLQGGIVKCVDIEAYEVAS